VIVSGGTEMSHCVVMVMTEPPEATPFRGSVKLTVEGAAETVRVWPHAGPARHKSAISAALYENLLRQKRDMTILEINHLKASFDQSRCRTIL
jgi:hypothetical protein